MTLTRLIRSNRHHARVAWGNISRLNLSALAELTRKYQLSVALGDIHYIDERWYVSHAGLLRLAERARCSGIRVRPVHKFCDASISRWVFSAIVYKTSSSRGFVGYGDADPSNVSSLVHGAEMRVAETRAVNRALRKAYGIGLCSVEELGCSSRVADPKPSRPAPASTAENNGHGNGHHNGQPRLRDRLCLLICQHRLDAALVKAYAADYCGKPTLREASRESVEAFINDLAERAAKDRDGLLCHLNSYAKSTEVSQ